MTGARSLVRPSRAESLPVYSVNIGQSVKVIFNSPKHSPCQQHAHSTPSDVAFSALSGSPPSLGASTRPFPLVALRRPPPAFPLPGTPSLLHFSAEQGTLSVMLTRFLLLQHSKSLLWLSRIKRHTSLHTVPTRTT